MIPLLIGLFLVILFIVTIVLSVATWRPGHIVALCLTFLASISMVIVGSLSVTTHTKWREAHAKVDSQLTTAQREGVNLEYGDPAMVEPPEPSVFDLQRRLNRMLLDRSRVWRRCTPGAPSADAIKVSTVPPLATGEPGNPATARPNGISANMVLYAFREDENQLPIAYLGEFQVVDAQPTGVTLTPSLPLDGLQQRLIADTSAFWTLYEMMPIDSHRVFAEEDTVGRSLDDTSSPIFGPVDEQKLRTMFSTVTLLPADSNEVTALVAPYLQDGRPAREQQVNPEDSIWRKLEIWQKLEFEKPHRERVDSNNPDPGLAGSHFDREGFAEASHLRRGEEALFRAKDIGVFPYAHDEDIRFVNDLIAAGTARNLGPFFVRSLRDYKTAFYELQNQYLQRARDMRRAQRDVEALNATIRQTQEQIAYRQEEREKLRGDLQGFQRDRQGVGQLVVALESQRSALSKELSDLFQMNLALSRQLDEYNAKVTEEINRRGAEVAMQVP